MAVTLQRNRPIANDELNALRGAAWTQVGDQDWRPILRRSLGWVCAVDGDRLVGFVNVAWDGGVHAFVLDTTVHPDYQRRGIGRELVHEAAALSRERGAEWLHVDYDDDLDAFYRGCGFRPTPAGLIDLTQPGPDVSRRDEARDQTGAESSGS
ncbi:MAG TPA: GNAT family N-acetyltransferase [Thermomicrobiales bacterium]|nr:GNAT family N-acetyltransferase [Thermomicrobiales bacterium]